MTDTHGNTLPWLEVVTGEAPLLVTFPHTGVDIPVEIERDFVSLWHARRDADWWIDRLYAFAHQMGATTVRTRISRSVIDVNRDPSGASLYPGQATTELCPTTDFDGSSLYLNDPPDAGEIDRRRRTWFDPYHAAITAELQRLRAKYSRVVLYDAHSIRSWIPRLFDGQLPQFNVGTNRATSCDPALEQGIAALCTASGHSTVVNGRFTGGWTTRHYGKPGEGIHAIQMELAIRGYAADVAVPDPGNWPPSYEPEFAAPMQAILREILHHTITFAEGKHA